MNENIDLTKILKNCPKGWEFYSSVLGEVEFVEICDDEKGENPIWVKVGKLAYTTGFTKEGFYLKVKENVLCSHLKTKETGASLQLLGIRKESLTLTR